MPTENRFRRLLPISQTLAAAFFGGLGLWQRTEALNQTWLGWDSTEKFHLWPGPFKFAVVSNMPAFLAGWLLSSPIEILWPTLPASAQIAPALLFVPILWYWIGSQLDRKWSAPHGARSSRNSNRPWALLLVFTLICVLGASLPIGHVGYLPYGVAVWLVTGTVVGRLLKNRPKALDKAKP
jgi:hypothetical protein